MSEKPLGHKAYGSIGHLPQSRLGPGDHSVNEGMARILLEQTRDKHDIVVVEEKLDGSNTAVAKVNGEVVALGRSGYRASTSRFEQHHLFDAWVRQRYALFLDLLEEGERLVGEWLALAHGTIYDTAHPGFSPWIVFDLIRGDWRRATVAERNERLSDAGVPTAREIHHAPAPFPLADLMEALEPSGHGADMVEGAVYRVERRGECDFLAKWVRPDKVDGCYLPGLNDCEPHWHWRAGR